MHIGIMGAAWRGGTVGRARGKAGRFTDLPAPDGGSVAGGDLLIDGGVIAAKFAGQRPTPG